MPRGVERDQRVTAATKAAFVHETGQRKPSWCFTARFQPRRLLDSVHRKLSRLVIVVKTGQQVQDITLQHQAQRMNPVSAALVSTDRAIGNLKLVLGQQRFGNHIMNLAPDFGCNQTRLRTDHLYLARPALDRCALEMCTQRFASRSEEHTSELQSLMRISYAVFCLKKKTKTNRSIITDFKLSHSELTS